MHTLAVTSDTGDVYCFGMGSGGQLGVTLTTNSSTPTLIQYNWNAPPPRQTTGGHSSTDFSKQEVPQLLESPRKIEIGSSVDPPSNGEEAMDVDELVDVKNVSTSDTKESDWTEITTLRRVYAGGDQSFASVKIVSVFLLMNTIASGVVKIL